MKQVTKKEFVKMYKENSIKGMVDNLGVSRQTIRNWANKFGLPKKQETLIIKEEGK